VAHHDLALAWPSFARLRENIALESMALLGGPGSVKTWIDAHAPKLESSIRGAHLAGFQRDAVGTCVADSLVQTMTYRLNVPRAELTKGCQHHMPATSSRGSRVSLAEGESVQVRRL
jgi:hypothetical protein